MGARTRHFTKKQVGYILALSCLFTTFIPSTGTAQTSSDWWDDAWSYRMELSLPLGLTSDVAFQPVDTTVSFPETCWAANEEKHSVRIIMHTNDDMMELPCQLYDLNGSHMDNHVITASLLEILPEFKLNIINNHNMVKPFELNEHTIQTVTGINPEIKRILSCICTIVKLEEHEEKIFITVSVVAKVYDLHTQEEIHSISLSTKGIGNSEETAKNHALKRIIEKLGAHIRKQLK